MKTELTKAQAWLAERIESEWDGEVLAGLFALVTDALRKGMDPADVGEVIAKPVVGWSMKYAFELAEDQVTKGLNPLQPFALLLTTPTPLVMYLPLLPEWSPVPGSVWKTLWKAAIQREAERHDALGWVFVSEAWLLAPKPGHEAAAALSALQHARLGELDLEGRFEAVTAIWTPRAETLPGTRVCFRRLDKERKLPRGIEVLYDADEEPDARVDGLMVS